ncbi:hypothetical protein [Sphingopyxis sp.]|uniref:hypothetical protein n=1 Tax=Sphingopyxis sp. TaxID=1908224 RepID=UPI003D1097E8
MRQPPIDTPPASHEKFSAVDIREMAVLGQAAFSTEWKKADVGRVGLSGLSRGQSYWPTPSSTEIPSDQADLLNTAISGAMSRSFFAGNHFCREIVGVSGQLPRPNQMSAQAR